MADNLSDALLSLVHPPEPRLPEALRRLAGEGLAQEHEIALFRSLARSLVRLHLPTVDPPEPSRSYGASLLETIAGPRGVLALLDSLPPEPCPEHDPRRLQALERRFLAWRWRLRPRSERLRQVHRELRLEQVVVPQSGEVVLLSAGLTLGDPALDVSAVAVALLALGAGDPLCWPDGYRLLADAFWSTYLADSGDHELLDVAPPFLAWRALQAAQGLPAPARRRLHAFVDEVLEQRSYNPDDLRWMTR